MVGLLPVAPHDGLGGRHHMVPHILRGACKVQLFVMVIKLILITTIHRLIVLARYLAVGNDNDNHNHHDYVDQFDSNHDDRKSDHHKNSDSNGKRLLIIIMMIIM